MPKFRTKPVVVDAVRVSEENKSQILLGDWGTLMIFDDPFHILIPDADEGDMRANPGDWIVRDDEGRVERWSDWMFRQRFEPADEEAERMWTFGS